MDFGPVFFVTSNGFIGVLKSCYIDIIPLRLAHIASVFVN